MFHAFKNLMKTNGFHVDLYPFVSTLRDEGKSLQAIADELNEAGRVTLKGKAFKKQTVGSLFDFYGENYNHRIHAKLVDGLALLLLETEKEALALDGLGKKFIAEAAAEALAKETKDKEAA